MKIIINLLYISIILLTSCNLKGNSIESSNKTQIDSTKSTCIEEIVEPEIPLKNCLYENKTFSLGLEVFEPSEKFNLYNDSNLTDLYSEINIYENGSEVDFCAKFNKSDYGIMQSWLNNQAVNIEEQEDGSTKKVMGNEAKDILSKLRRGNKDAINRIKENKKVSEKYQLDNFDLITWFLVSI